MQSLVHIENGILQQLTGQGNEDWGKKRGVREMWSPRHKATIYSTRLLAVGYFKLTRICSSTDKKNVSHGGGGKIEKGVEICGQNS